MRAERPTRRRDRPEAVMVKMKMKMKMRMRHGRLHSQPLLLGLRYNVKSRARDTKHTDGMQEPEPVMKE